MRFTGVVVTEAGQPVASATAALVEATTRGFKSIAVGKITAGQLSLSGEPGLAWGVLIDGKPVVTLVKRVTAKTIELCDIVWQPKGVTANAFHASEGLVFGLPSPLSATVSSAVSAAAVRAAGSPGAEVSASPRAAAAAVAGAVGDVSSALPRAAAVNEKMTMSFADALSSTARQLGGVRLSESPLAFAGASITLKGIPVATNDAIGLEFPDAELIKSGVGLSELRFAVETKASAPTTKPVASQETTPDLVGYTVELAQRKAASRGFTVELNREVVTGERDVGRVVRQSPAAGTQPQPNAIMRLYVGKRTGGI